MGRSKRKSDDTDINVQTEEHAMFDDDDDALALKEERRKKRKEEKVAKAERAEKIRSVGEDSELSGKAGEQGKNDKKEKKEKSKKRSLNSTEVSSSIANDALLELVNSIVPPCIPQEPTAKQQKSVSIEPTASLTTAEGGTAVSITAVEPAHSSVAPSTGGGGSYRPETKEWMWNLTPDIVLRVGTVCCSGFQFILKCMLQLRGRQFVDIRHLWEGKPTKKGAFLPVHLFEEIQKWPKLQEALEKTRR